MIIYFLLLFCLYGDILVTFNSVRGMINEASLPGDRHSKGTACEKLIKFYVGGFGSAASLQRPCYRSH